MPRQEILPSLKTSKHVKLVKNHSIGLWGRMPEIWGKDLEAASSVTLQFTLMVPAPAWCSGGSSAQMWLITPSGGQPSARHTCPSPVTLTVPDASLSPPHRAVKPRRGTLLILLRPGSHSPLLALGGILLVWACIP